jgi:predicted ATPase
LAAQDVPPRVAQLYIRNFRSLAEVAVDLPAFAVLVGPNGAGKSNFIDALAFTRDCLGESVELAFKNRGGIRTVRRISGGHPTNIGIRVVAHLDRGAYADYTFEIAAKSAERFAVVRERCLVELPGGGRHRFEVKRGTFVQEISGIRPQVQPDRLALFAASATDEFRPVYDFLTSMRFFSVDPERLRDLQEPDVGEFLKRDAANAAAVLKRIREDHPDRYERIKELLARAVPGITAVDYRAVGQREAIEFKQDVGLPNPWTFPAINMSDGTLRLLGLLLAVYQPGNSSVIAIEEPEATVHPAITDLLVQVLQGAAEDRQVLLTTHSPDILDFKSLTDAEIRVVTKEHNQTLVAPLGEISRRAIREHLYTPGELLRVNELEPDVATARKLGDQITLFGPALPPADKWRQ